MPPPFINMYDQNEVKLSNLRFCSVQTKKGRVVEASPSSIYLCLYSFDTDSAHLIDNIQTEVIALKGVIAFIFCERGGDSKGLLGRSSRKFFAHNSYAPSS